MTVLGRSHFSAAIIAITHISFQSNEVIKNASHAFCCLPFGGRLDRIRDVSSVYKYCCMPKFSSLPDKYYAHLNPLHAI